MESCSMVEVPRGQKTLPSSCCSLCAGSLIFFFFFPVAVGAQYLRAGFRLDGRIFVEHVPLGLAVSLPWYRTGPGFRPCL